MTQAIYNEEYQLGSQLLNHTKAYEANKILENAKLHIR